MRYRNLNLGNILVAAGMGWLGFSFWLPYATANRVFRIDSHTIRVTREITALALKEQKIDWEATVARDRIVTHANESLGMAGAENPSRLRVVQTPRTLKDLGYLFRDDRYFYLLTSPPKRYLGQRGPITGPARQDRSTPGRSPLLPRIPSPGEHFDPALDLASIPLPEDQLLPFETYAWPIRTQPGVRTVFLSPSDNADVFTRNLSSRYVGLAKHPRPGGGRRDIDSEKKENDYRGYDNERWIYQASNL